MKKVLLGLLALYAVLFVCVETQAAIDATARKAIEDIRKGRNNKNQILDLRVKETITIGTNVVIEVTTNGSATIEASGGFPDGLEVTGELDVTGSIDVTGSLTTSIDVVTADLRASDDLFVTDDATISGALLAVETATFSNNVDVVGSLTSGVTVAAADLAASDDLTVGDDATVGDRFYLGTNGYFAISSTNLVWVGTMGTSEVSQVIATGL